ncbi:TetR/AcrR family transcriptional regulator [Actinoallomurus iriomotensis]|uniref:HTH-type transcriptional regulator PksA n=1 Tax=Actinoallomurus iriomotensis TaxID=478107 RepID=A0A9W6W5V3_9ACTN|nr:TetR/AcrR family transcriptional regulator [Actinoallomurus iriomotensis]GLY92450.1 HTH-type transcriptional regulator PksA [Actinoallomurus iriomotensis]
MPRRVDHDERRRQIAEAVLRIAAGHGLEAVSMREVAAEAGVSIGRVQHYFASKNQMLVFAAGHLREHLEQRIRRSIAAAGHARTPLRSLRAILVALLPLDQDGRKDALAGVAVLIRALGEPELAERYRSGRSAIVAAVVDLLRSASDAGELRGGLDPELEANILLALVGGLASDLLLGHHTPERATAIVDHQLERLT